MLQIRVVKISYSCTMHVVDGVKEKTIKKQQGRFRRGRSTGLLNILMSSMLLLSLTISCEVDASGSSSGDFADKSILRLHHGVFMKHKTSFRPATGHLSSHFCCKFTAV